MRPCRVAAAAAALLVVGICHSAAAAGGRGLTSATMRLKGGFKRTMMVAMNSKEVPKLDPSKFVGDGEEDMYEFVDQVCAEEQELEEEIEAFVDEAGYKRFDVTDEEAKAMWGNVTTRRWPADVPQAPPIKEEDIPKDKKPEDVYDQGQFEEDAAESYRPPVGDYPDDWNIEAVEEAEPATNSLAAQLANLGFTEAPGDAAAGGAAAAAREAEPLASSAMDAEPEEEEATYKFDESTKKMVKVDGSDKAAAEKRENAIALAYANHEANLRKIYADGENAPTVNYMVPEDELLMWPKGAVEDYLSTFKPLCALLPNKYQLPSFADLEGLEADIDDYVEYLQEKPVIKALNEIPKMVEKIKQDYSEELAAHVDQRGAIVNASIERLMAVEKMMEENGGKAPQPKVGDPESDFLAAAKAMDMAGYGKDPMMLASVNKMPFEKAKQGRNIRITSSLFFPIWLPIPRIPPLVRGNPLPFLKKIPSIPGLLRPATRVRLTGERHGTFANDKCRSPLHPRPSQFGFRRLDPMDSMSRDIYLSLPANIETSQARPHKLLKPLKKSAVAGGLAQTIGAIGGDGEPFNYFEVRVQGNAKCSSVGVLVEGAYDPNERFMDHSAIPLGEYISLGSDGGFDWKVWDDAQPVAGEGELPKGHRELGLAPSTARSYRRWDRIGVFMDVRNGKIAFIKNGEVILVRSGVPTAGKKWHFYVGMASKGCQFTMTRKSVAAKSLAGIPEVLRKAIYAEKEYSMTAETDKEARTGPVQLGLDKVAAMVGVEATVSSPGVIDIRL